MRNNILTFFFGSPYSGFGAFPPQYSNWVSGFDTKKSEFPVICKYLIKDNKTTFKYVEYNLADEERTGRNFGVWLQIEHYKLETGHEDEVLNFIKDFVNEILEEREHFFKKGKKPHFYIIKSFNDANTEDIISTFNKLFLENYKKYLIPTSNADFLEKDLILYEETKPEVEITDQSNNGTDVENSNNLSFDNEKEKRNDKLEKKKEKSFLKNLQISAATLLLFFLFCLSFIYSMISKMELEDKIEELQKIISDSRLNQSKSNNTSSTTLIGNNKKTSNKPDNESEILNDKNFVIVESGGLWQIISNYNTENGTSFKLKEIAELNKIEKKIKKDKNNNDIIDYPIQVGQKIHFPNKQ